jgi:hypothetical protein
VSSGSSSGGVPTLRNLHHSNSGRSSRRRRSFSSLSTNEERDEVVPIDEPYSQQQPRSQFSLNRAATIAAVAPATRLHLRALPDQPLEYRRADGMREIPHESDADNWVPPPPPYTERPDNAFSHPVGTNTIEHTANQRTVATRPICKTTATKCSTCSPDFKTLPGSTTPYTKSSAASAFGPRTCINLCFWPSNIYSTLSAHRISFQYTGEWELFLWISSARYRKRSTSPRISKVS